MKRILLLCLSLCLILTCLCACFDSENADGETVRINTVDESGKINGYFDFVYDGDTIIGVNQCNKHGKVLLYGSDLKIDDYGNITQIVFRDPDEKLVKTIRWAFPDSISPQAINFNENLIEKYLNQGLMPGYGVETSSDGFVKVNGDVGDGDGSIEYEISTYIISGGFSFGSFGHVTIPTTFDTFYASPVGYLDLSLCEDSIPGAVFDFMIPNDINAEGMLSIDQYAATISDENDRIVVYHDYTAIYGLFTSINHCIYSYDEDGTIKEIKVVYMIEMPDLSTTGMSLTGGNVLVVNSEDSLPSGSYYATVIPEYDEGGVLISAKAYTKTDRLGAESAFENGNLKETVFYVDDGQKVVSAYLGDGNVHETIYDADGNIIEESDYNENEIHFN